MAGFDITMSSDKAATGEDAEEQSLGGVSNLDFGCSFGSFNLFDLKEPGAQGQFLFYPRQSCTLRNLGLVIRWPQMRWEAFYIHQYSSFQFGPFACFDHYQIC